MAELLWIVLAALIFGLGGYLVASRNAQTRRDMEAYTRRHHYVEPDL